MLSYQIAWTVVAACLILFWLAFAVIGVPKLEIAGATVVMRYGRVLGLTALILALAPPTMLIPLMWNVPWRGAQILVNVGACFSALSFVAGLLLIEVVRVRIVLTADGIVRRSPWTGDASMKWSEVKSVRFSPLNRWFVIRTDSATIRVSQFLTGQAELRQAIHDKVPAERRIGCHL